MSYCQGAAGREARSGVKCGVMGMKEGTDADPPGGRRLSKTRHCLERETEGGGKHGPKCWSLGGREKQVIVFLSRPSPHPFYISHIPPPFHCFLSLQLSH